MALPIRPGQGLPIKRPEVSAPRDEVPVEEIALPSISLEPEPRPVDEFTEQEDDAFASPSHKRLSAHGAQASGDTMKRDHRQILENTDEHRGPSRENLQRLGGALADESKNRAPKIPAPELPAPTSSSARPERSDKRPNRLASHGEPRAEARPESAQKPQEEIDERWHIDPETGKRFKDIPGYKDGVKFTKAKTTEYAKHGMSFSDLRTFVGVDEDFNMDDLSGTAETFLPHLRVPPNKEEQERLRKARAAQQKEHDRAYEQAVAEENTEEEAELTAKLGIEKKKPWWRRKSKKR